MLVLRCTGKLQKGMGLTKADLCDIEPSDTVLGDWYANLLLINRRNGLLFTNEKTLFNFIVPDVPRKAIRELGSLFYHRLKCVFAEEGFDSTAQKCRLEDDDEVLYGPTRSRSVLGPMNDLAYHYQCGIQESGSAHSAEIPNIIRRLNRMPMSAIGHRHPIDVLQGLL